MEITDIRDSDIVSIKMLSWLLEISNYALSNSLSVINFGSDFYILCAITVARPFTEYMYDVARGILKFKCKTWECRATSYSVNSHAIIVKVGHDILFFCILRYVKIISRITSPF